jgi:hypothetical protein
MAEPPVDRHFSRQTWGGVYPDPQQVVTVP